MTKTIHIFDNWKLMKNTDDLIVTELKYESDTVNKQIIIKANKDKTTQKWSVFVYIIISHNGENDGRVHFHDDPDVVCDDKYICGVLKTYMYAESYLLEKHFKKTI